MKREVCTCDQCGKEISLLTLTDNTSALTVLGWPALKPEGRRQRQEKDFCGVACLLEFLSGHPELATKLGDAYNKGREDENHYQNNSEDL